MEEDRFIWATSVTIVAEVSLKTNSLVLIPQIGR
jgi:hypothetical protein